MRFPWMTASRTKRPDAEIFAAARHALDERPEIPGTVRVHVERGVVTLTGTVRWAAERQAAEHTAAGVAGVRRVVNEITVAQTVRPEGFEAPDSRA